MKRIKSNKGISMADLVIAISIFILLSGVIGNLFYQIAYNNAALRMNAVAVEYAIKVAEYIDEIAYDEVTNELNNLSESNIPLIVEKLNEKYEIKMLSDRFKISINIEKYNSDDLTKQDIIKKVNIKVDYMLLEEFKSYEINKLKINENIDGEKVSE